MGVLSRLLGERREHPRSLSERILAAFDSGYDTASGAHVTEESSLQVTAVYACVRVLAEAEAVLPLHLYRRLDRGKERATDHPLYALLHSAPNPEMTAYEFREALTGHTALRGNAYAEIEWSSSGQVRYLWPLRPDRTRPDRFNGRLTYLVTMPDGNRVRLPAWRVMHIRGFGGDGIRGYNPIYMARQSVGLAMAAEEFGSRLFGNGAKPGGILEHPGKLSPEAHERLRKSVEMRHQGLSNAHRLMILEEGMSWKQVGMAPEDAQFLQTRNFQVVEIARLFGVPPHKIAELTHATFSNIEHQGLDFVVSSLTPWLVRWEQRIGQSLLSTSEQSQYFAEHLVDGLLRGDIQSRYQAYNVGIQSGILTRNEVRERENLNPLEGLDRPLVPLNMVESGERGGGEAERRRGEWDLDQIDPLLLGDVERRAQATAGDRQEIANAQAEVLLDSMDRVVRREVNDIRRAVDKYLVRANDLTGFLFWLDEFYIEHASFIQRNLRSGLRALAGLVVASVNRELDGDVTAAALADFLAEFLEGLANRWAGGNAQQIRALVREAEPVEAIRERLDSWEETEAQANARRETSRAVNALAYAAYGIAGVSLLRWVARGENCPYCRALNGRVVGYGEAFAQQGDFEVEGAEPLKLRRRHLHPPLHDGCDCMTVASR